MIIRLSAQVRLRDLVSNMSELVGQIVAAECSAQSIMYADASAIDRELEEQANSIFLQRRNSLSFTELQALLKPAIETLLADTTPKV